MHKQKKRRAVLSIPFLLSNAFPVCALQEMG